MHVDSGFTVLRIPDFKITLYKEIRVQIYIYSNLSYLT